MEQKLITNELFDLICHRLVPGEDAVIYITSRNFDGGAKAICDELNHDVSFYELCVDNWDDNLTPWEADPKMKGRLFGGKASILLETVINEVVPLIKLQNENVFIAGYSLAGLFSLWALYESDVFSGCACCSGSLWYPGWTEYIKENEFISSSSVYLSIGDREKNSKNEFMKKVEEVYSIQQVQLNGRNVTLHFDLNEGGHFNNVNERVIKGINWLLSGTNI